MAVKRLMALTLAGVLFIPPTASPAVPLAVLTGVVMTVQGHPLTQLDLDLVNLDNGKVTPIRTDGVGAFRTAVDPGLYTVDAGRSGYKVARGPRVVSLASGGVGTAEIALASLQSGDQSGTDSQVATLELPREDVGFFRSRKGIIVLSVIGIGAIVTVVFLTRDKNKKASPNT